MRAVNLIPAQERRGAGLPSFSAYAVIGALVLALAAVTFYVVTGNSINDRKAKLARVTQQAAAAEQRAAVYGPYQRFAQLEQTRVQTVTAIAGTRFDWHRSLEELSRAIPSSVWLSSLLGTVAPGVAVDGAGSTGTGSLRSGIAAPAIEMSGCTNNFDDVARLMSRLRTLSDVQRVTLADSTKSESSVAPSTGGSSGGGAVGSGDCRYGSSKVPQFDMVVFFNPLPAAAPAAAASTTGGTTAPVSTTTPGSSK